MDSTLTCDALTFLNSIYFHGDTEIKAVMNYSEI